MIYGLVQQVNDEAEHGTHRDKITPPVSYGCFVVACCRFGSTCSHSVVSIVVSIIVPFGKQVQVMLL